MLYLRLSIGVVLILLCTKLGKNKGNKYKSSLNFYESCLTFCNLFKSDLLYKRSKLQDFLKVNYLSNDFKEMLEYFLENRSLNYYPEYLNDDERIEIFNFLSVLGKTDSLSQLEMIDAYKNKFTLKLTEKTAEFKKYYSLTTKLGFVIGLGFLIMVV